MFLPVFSGDVLGDFSAENAIVHEKKLDVLGVSHKEFLEAVFELMSGLSGALGADLGHFDGASVSAAHSVVDTSGLSPAFLKTSQPTSLLTPTRLYRSLWKRLGCFFCFLIAFVLESGATAIISSSFY